jgi:hypothetical protein
MKLWEKQCAYILRRFVVVEVVEHDHFDRGRGGRARPSRSPVLAGSSGSRFCWGVAELGDGRHRKPRQASAVTYELTTKEEVMEDYGR